MQGFFRKIVCLGALMGFVAWGTCAHANLKVIKAYKETYPDAKPKCIMCHVDTLPKKPDGEHEHNAYGKALVQAAKDAKEELPSSETIKKVGPVEDFQDKTAPVQK